MHGVTVGEEYRWLEQTDRPEVKNWIAQQNKLTQQVLGSQPRRVGIKKEFQDMLGGNRVSRFNLQYTPGRLFALKRQPPRNQPLLVMLASPLRTASERVVLDPNKFDPTGKTTIDWFVPSHDGRLVAVSLSANGSELGTLHVFETASGRKRSDVVPRVQVPTGGGSVAWQAEGLGLFYTRYPQGNERAPEDANFYQQIWYHRLGTPSAQDEYVLGKDFPRIAEIALKASEDGRFILADVSNGDGGEHAFHVRDTAGNWIQLAGFTDGFRSVDFGRDGRLYALALKGSPRGRIVTLPLERLQEGLQAASTLIAQTEAVIEAFAPTKSRLYVQTLVGGPSELRVFDLAGNALELLGEQDVSSMQIGTRLWGDAILFGRESFVEAFAWYAYDPAKSGRKAATRPFRTALTDAPVYSVRGGLPGMKVVREFATSRDGTQVPVNIVCARGTQLDGNAPALLTAYGGYGISMRPQFTRSSVMWLRHGGVFALANLRGGGEFGEEWHLAGNLTHKQNVFDDFIASAQLLISRGYTSAQRLAIRGGSNGGLLMGAVTVQHPELFRAVVSSVGIYDMLRVELTPNGAFNVTEFGSVKDPDQFKALLDYSPLHHVRDGLRYPAMLLTTGEHDGRVEPWMSYKMTARMQAAAAPGSPILLRVAADAGHGLGTALSSRVEEDADVFTFLFDQLDMP
jgi:prolyl oligopeptidase